MDDYYNESILDLETLKKLPPPHIVHADKGGLFPTHTHGLNLVNLPEMFINHTAFGSVDNCATINETFVYIMLNSSEFNKVIEGIDIEFQLWPKESDLILCVRKVLPSFSGVSAAYSQEEITGDLKGFRHLYVKGDDHVLTSEYFNEIIKKLDALPDVCTCGQHLGG